MQSGSCLGLTYLELIRADSSPRYLAFSVHRSTCINAFVWTPGRFLPFLCLIHSSACGREGSGHEERQSSLLPMSLASLFEVCEAFLVTTVFLKTSQVLPVIPCPPPHCFL